MTYFSNSQDSHIINKIKDISAEAQIHVNQLLTQLSAEAKFVLYSIFNAPDELLEYGFDNPTVYKIEEYLKLLEKGKKKRLKLLEQENLSVNEKKKIKKMFKERPKRADIAIEVFNFAKEVLELNKL